MSKKKRFPCLILFVLSCCVCAIAGVSLLPRVTEFIAQLSLPMIDTYPTVSPRRPDAVILASDDFSNPNRGWQTGSWNNGRVDYSNGGYLVNVTDINIYTYLEHSFPADVSIEVDITAQGDGELFFGVTCRDQNELGYDLLFGGTKATGMAFPTIDFHTSEGNLSFPPEQLTYGTIFFWPPNWERDYHLRADCIGNQLSLYVNGHLVQQVSDSRHITNGRIGLFGGHVSGANVAYLFDNFIVYQP